MDKIIFGIIGVTYRCNAKCVMCNIWKYPTKKEEEFSPRILEKLPEMPVLNITGGEPFLRDDLQEIIDILEKKSKRIVISTNGFLTDHILKFADKNKNVGFRLSIEGFPSANDKLRGLQDGFDKGLRTLLELKNMKFTDIGFGITVSDTNARDLLPLYNLAKDLNFEFATAIVHNTYYFKKFDNVISDKNRVAREFRSLIYELLDSRNIKDWFRAYFNYGIVNYIAGNPRLLPCEMGSSSFYLDPYGLVRVCNGRDEIMGDLNGQSFGDIWASDEAGIIRALVRNCDKNCWMIGSVGELMKKKIGIPIQWIIRNKFLRKADTENLIDSL
jgi:MoaA/NifB/PqqE/SkfB family radical SAM enzyme